jgi:hypothetical protein
VNVRRIPQWWSLPASERKVFMQLLLLLSLVWLGLRGAGFARMRRWAEAGRIALPMQAEVAAQIAQRYALLTAIAARHGLYHANCLHQALALCRLLRREGIPAELKIGVRMAHARLDAHAWVELAGKVLGEPVSGYAAFDRLELGQKVTG